MKKDKWIFGLTVGAGIAGLTYALWPKKRIPKKAIINNFDRDKYLGVWHEIARLPNRIEKNLRDLSEEYSLNHDGTMKVITRAYNFEKNKPVEAEGKIKFKGSETCGRLEVAYYLPLYLDYNVLDVDADYKYALVSGSGFDYLWILSRENGIPENIKTRFLAKAEALGFDIAALEWM